MYHPLVHCSVLLNIWTETTDFLEKVLFLMGFGKKFPTSNKELFFDSKQ